MGTLLSYSLYSSIVLALLYLTYKWMMAGENQHSFNRLALLGIYCVALLALPLSGWLAGVGGSSVPLGAEIVVEEFPVMLGVAGPAVAAGQPLWLTIVLWVYLTGVAVALTHTLLVGFRLRAVIAAGERVATYNNKVVVVTDDEGIAPFSWCRYVVMNRRDWDEAGEMILLHELRHLGLAHWLDLLMAQVVGIVQWFNPAAWLMREELKTVHEYQADSAVIASGVCMRDYQMLLIKKAVGARFPSLANSLNHSKLKKRITMMYNQKSSPGRRMRVLALVPALGIAFAVANLDAVASVISETASARFIDRETPASSGSGATEISAETLIPDTPRQLAVSGADAEAPAVADKGNENSVASQVEVATPAALSESTPVSVPAAPPAVESKETASDEAQNLVYTMVDKKPEFPGGDKELMMQIAQTMRYPESAYKAGIQGRVVVQFVVNADGTVGDTKVIRSVDPALDEEAVRVVKALPAFTPGMLNGKPVAVMYTLPVSFKLTQDKTGGKPQTGMTLGEVVDQTKAENPDMEFYIDGAKVSEANVKALDPKKIQSVDVKKDTKPAQIRITLK